MIQRYKGISPRIDPTAWVHPNATLIGDVTLGAYVSVWPGVVMRGDCGPITVAANSNIQDGTIVHTTGAMSETHIGERVTVGHNVILHGCRVGNDCLIGMGATLLDNCTLGARTLVAAGSLVTYNSTFAEGGLVIGSPGRWKAPLNDKHIAMIDDAWPLYIEYSEPFRNGDVVTIG